MYCEKLCESVFASSLNMKDNTMIKNNYYENTHSILGWLPKHFLKVFFFHQRITQIK